MSRKVIIVAQEVLHTFFHDNYQKWDWDVQAPCEDIASLWSGLESGALSNESEIVIFLDELYEQSPDEFAEAVALFAPEALVLILSYTEGIEEYIKLAVSEKAEANAVASGEKYEPAPFYFIRPQVALQEIDEIVDFYDHGQEAAIKIKQTTAPVRIDVETAGEKVDTSRNGLVVTVTSSKGGSGKSSVAILLATQLAKSSKKAYDAGQADRPLDICVVDLDTFDGQLGFVLGHMTPTALNIALAEGIRDAALVKSNLVYNERMGIHALLAPVRGATARFTDPTFYAEVIGILRTMFDVVILDTSVQHYDELIRTVALPLADAILLVTTLDIKSVKGLARWMDVARRPVTDGGHGVDRSKIGIVVNGSLEGVGMGNQELTTAALGAKLLVAIPLDTRAVQAAGNANRLEDIIEHPTIGPEYFRLATRVGKARGFNLLPVLEEYEPVPVARPNTTGVREPEPKKPSSGFPWSRRR